MDVKQHQRFVITDRSYANIVKRDITRLAEGLGFSATEVGRINIVVSEMTSNLYKHSPEGGELLVKLTEDGALEIICLDRGPGMRDPQRMLQDGNSTAGTAGEGLGAIKRQSHTFDMYTHTESGTVLLSRIYKGKNYKPDAKTPFQVAALLVPKLNEQFCGDGFAMVTHGTNCYFIALDGLGHGNNAYEASSEAAREFLKNHTMDPANHLRLIHGAIRKTRGAVGTIVNISMAQKKLSYCGIGNIAGKVFTADGPVISNITGKNIIAYNGILGYNIPSTLHTHSLEWDNSKLLIVHSDGIKSRWDLARYPNLHRHDPAIIAAIVYRDFSRQTDDTLVIVARSRH